MLDKAEFLKGKIIEQENQTLINGSRSTLRSEPIQLDNDTSPNPRPLPKIPGISPSPFIIGANRGSVNNNNINGIKLNKSVEAISPTETLINPTALIPLLNNYNLSGNPTLLFIDARPSYLFQEERMNVTQLVNIEPLVLKRKYVFIYV